MAEPNSLPVVQSYCRYLRAKEMFIDVEPDKTVPRSSSGHFWCVHTQTVLGPDGKVVSDGECRSDRICFEAV
jgi:hypothetical protein